VGESLIMFELIDAGFLALYGPASGDPDRDMISSVMRIFASKDYSFTTSGVRWDDRTFAVSMDIHKVLHKLYLAIQRGVCITDVPDKDVPPFSFNWHERVPSMFKRYAAGQDNGQAKIFFSVMVALSALEGKSNLHIFVPGSGSMEQGWSYSAAAEYLTRKKNSGIFELWDPLAVDTTGQIGNFSLNYHKGKAPEIPLTATHVLDDSYPCVLQPRQVVAAVERNVVVSVKMRLDGYARGSIVPFRLPSRIFSQPFYYGAEKRVVYNYKPPIKLTPNPGCFCSDCLKRSEHYVSEDVEHHIFGLGIRPCYPLPGYQLLKECYPFRSGHVVDYATSLLRMPPNMLQRFRQYGILRQTQLPSYTGIEVRNVVIQRREVRAKGKKRKKVVANTMEKQLWGWLQKGERMTQKRIVYPDSFPLLFYDPSWIDSFKEVYPRVQCAREGVGFRAFSPKVAQPVAGHFKMSKDDMMERKISLSDSSESLDLANPYRVQIPDTLRPRGVLFVSYGPVRSSYVVLKGRRWDLLLQEEFRSLHDFRMSNHDKPYCYLNDPGPGRVYLFAVR